MLFPYLFHRYHGNNANMAGAREPLRARTPLRLCAIAIHFAQQDAGYNQAPEQPVEAEAKQITRLIAEPAGK